MSEPPRKKRRSKWGIKPEEMEKSSSSSPTVQGPKGAEEAAAKINAMLAAQGKLVKSDPPPYKAVLKPPAHTQSHTSATPLFSGSSSYAGLLSTPLIPPTVPATTHTGPHYVQDKIFVGMANAPSMFNVREKLEGPNGCFLSHIATQTAAKVFLRGQGSGYIEPTSKKESFEALHIYVSHSNQNGMEASRKLCESLIQTVQKECDNFLASQQMHQPLGYGGTPDYGPHGPYVNPYQHPVPGGPPGGPPGGYGPPPHGHPMPGHPYPLPAPYQGPPLGPPDYRFYPHHPSNFPPPQPLMNPGGPPPGSMPHPQGYYGAPSPYPLLAPRAPPLQPLELPPEPNPYPEFERHDREPEPVMKRKFTEVPGSAAGSMDAAQISITTGNASVGEPAPLLSRNGEDPGNHRGTPSGGDGAPSREFKETPPASRRRFEEAPLPPEVAKVPRGFQEVPLASRVNGEPSERQTATGKWQSLVHASDVLEKGPPASSSQKERGSEEKESKPVFARPTLTSNEIDAILMPPPKVPGSLNRPKAVAKTKAEAATPVLSNSSSAATVSPTAATESKPPVQVPDLPSSGAVAGPQPAKRPISLVSYSSEDSDSDADM